MVAHTHRHIAYFSLQVTEVERLIRQHILAEIQDIAVLSSAKQLSAHAGLTLEQVVSSSSVRGQSRLTKFGNRRLRTALFFPALVAMDSHLFPNAFAQRHLAKGYCKMSVVALLMHKLIRII